MHRSEMGSTTLPIPTRRLMSLTGLSLSGMPASKNRFRFTRPEQSTMQTLNDVLAHISLNDVVALET